MGWPVRLHCGSATGTRSDSDKKPIGQKSTAVGKTARAKIAIGFEGKRESR